MIYGILDTIERTARAAGEWFTDAFALCLLCAPAVLFIGYAIVYIANANARGKGKGAFLVFGDLCAIGFAALAVCAFEFRQAVLYVGVALALKGAVLILYGALSCFPRKRETGKAQPKKIPAAEYVDMSAEYPAPVSASASVRETVAPAKVRCYTDPVYTDEVRETFSSDVRLDHIFSVVEQLKGVSLGAGDRLQVQKYEDLLTVYKNKGALSAEEAQTLNDILASLLKMMAKYDL